jgi:LAO/AO transport system kinase
MLMDLDDLMDKVMNKDKKSISKLISMIEENPYVIKSISRYIWAKRPKSHIVGITGSAGVGKSTLISALINELARAGKNVAAVVIDPSSPFSGGAILGDRLRFRGIRNDVYIRSMSTQAEESLPWKALLAIEILEGVGYDYILIETPGIGQFNVRVMRAADTVIVTLMPGAGDEIQAIKAGIMEVGDIYLINKSDIPEAELTYGQTLFAVENIVRDGWKPPVLKVSALHRKGIKEVLSVLFERWNHLIKSGLASRKRAERRKLEVEMLLTYRLMKELNKTLAGNIEARNIMNKVEKGEIDTVTASEVLMERIVKSFKPY